jgi:hypothetical protein
VHKCVLEVRIVRWPPHNAPCKTLQPSNAGRQLILSQTYVTQESKLVMSKISKPKCDVHKLTYLLNLVSVHAQHILQKRSCQYHVSVVVKILNDPRSFVLWVLLCACAWTNEE